MDISLWQKKHLAIVRSRAHALARMCMRASGIHHHQADDLVAGLHYFTLFFVLLFNKICKGTCRGKALASAWLGLSTAKAARAAMILTPPILILNCIFVMIMKGIVIGVG